VLATRRVLDTQLELRRLLGMARSGQSEALRANQSQSEALKGTPRRSEAQSEALREAVSGQARTCSTIRSRVAIRGNQRPSEAIDETHLLLVALAI
jgi:hypothetical protein